MKLIHNATCVKMRIIVFHQNKKRHHPAQCCLGGPAGTKRFPDL